MVAGFKQRLARFTIAASLISVCACLCAPIADAGGRDVYVRGYYRSNGTYVMPHYQSAPDGNFWNNWSTIGNVNPYTGQWGTRTHPSYGSSYSWSYPSYGYSPSYRQPSYGASWLDYSTRTTAPNWGYPVAPSVPTYVAPTYDGYGTGAGDEDSGDSGGEDPGE